MPAQELRAARHDRAHGAALHRTQAMVGAVGPAMRTKDIGELHFEPEVPRGALVASAAARRIVRANPVARACSPDASAPDGNSAWLCSDDHGP